MKIDCTMRMTDGECEFVYSETNQKWELCAYLDNGGKYVIAFFDKESEGYDMRTVGNRFFNHDSFEIAKKGMEFLEMLFELEGE